MRLVRNTVSALAATGWAMIVGIVSLPFLLHGLGAVSFGLWILIQTFSAVNGWAALADLGVGAALTRFLAEKIALGDAGAARSMAASGMYVFAGLAVVCLPVVAAIGIALMGPLHVPDGLRSGFQQAVLLFAMQVAFELVIEGSEALLEGAQRLDLSRLFDGGRRTAVAVAVCVAATLFHSLAVVALCSCCVTGVVMLLALVVSSRRVAWVRARPRRPDINSLLRYGAQISVLNLSGVVHRSIDRVIVGLLLGPGYLAGVEIAIQVQSAASAVLSASAAAVSPAVSLLHARADLPAIRRVVTRGTQFTLLVTAPAVLVPLILAEPLLRVWVGAPYTGSADLVRVATLYVAALLPIQVGINALQGAGRVRPLMATSVAATGVNLVMSIAFARVFGPIGVFYGTLVGMAVQVPSNFLAIQSLIDAKVATFLRESMRRAVLPVGGLSLVLLSVTALRLAPWQALAVGLGAGLGGYLIACARVIPVRELRAVIATQK